jgi:hypothetical protein
MSIHIPIKKPLHHALRKPVRARACKIERPSEKFNLAEFAPNNADPNDNRGFRGNQSRLEEDEKRRERIYRMYLINLLRAKRNRK